jgi:hypothetical protein
LRRLGGLARAMGCSAPALGLGRWWRLRGRCRRAGARQPIGRCCFRARCRSELRTMGCSAPALRLGHWGRLRGRCRRAGARQPIGRCCFIARCRSAGNGISHGVGLGCGLWGVALLRYAWGGAVCQVVCVEQELDTPKSNPDIEQGLDSPFGGAVLGHGAGLGCGLWGVALLRYAWGGAVCQVVCVEQELDTPKSNPDIERGLDSPLGGAVLGHGGGLRAMGYRTV